MLPVHSDPVLRLQGKVAAALDRIAEAESLAVGLSGGRDSVVLLDALCATAPERDILVRALHVHHGLSPHADEWQAFCEALCETRRVPLTVERVEVSRESQTSLENEARRARYAALAAAANASDTRYVALAHHRDDQAETLLLQLLRGAGPHGLAGMPPLREDARGVFWWRPLLDVSRADIDAYAQAAALRWVDDESNASTRHVRNAVRHVVMPALAGIADAAATTLARAAAHQAEAVMLADDLATLDACDAFDGVSLDVDALRQLAPHRARNLVRWFLHQRGLPMPSAARLAAMLSQIEDARDDAHVRIAHAGMDVGVFRGRVYVHAPEPAPFDAPWRGEDEVVLPHGRLAFVRGEGSGIDVARLRDASLRVRSRAGGERLQLAHNRPRRALKSILHDAGIPPWDRAGLPLVYCGDALVAVANIGVDAAFAAAPGAPSITLVWQPAQHANATT